MEGQKPKKPITKKWWFWAIVVVVVIGVIGSIGDDDSTTTQQPSEQRQSEDVAASAEGEPGAGTEPGLEPEPKLTTEVEPEPEVQPEPKPEEESKVIKAGMYKVGRDIEAGEYKVIPEGSMSYVEVSKDSTGDLYSIVSNDIFDAEKYITVQEGQYIKLTGCSLK